MTLLKPDRIALILFTLSVIACRNDIEPNQIKISAIDTANTDTIYTDSIIPSRSFDSTGWYILGSATSFGASSNYQLEKAYIADGLNNFNIRYGAYDAFVNLKSGEFTFVKFHNSSIDFSSYGSISAEESVIPNEEYLLRKGYLTSVSETATYIEKPGLYYVFLDSISEYFLVIPISHFSLVGPSVGNDWQSEIRVYESNDNSAKVIYELFDLPMHTGEYKIRYNSSWVSENLLNETGIIVPTNLGSDESFGVPTSVLYPSGRKFNMSAENEGVYTVRLTISESKGRSINCQLIKTGDITPIDFDPSNYNWGILGTATDAGWIEDLDFDYLGEDMGRHTWAIICFLQDGGFKYRINDNWNFSLGPDNSFHTGPASNLISHQNDFLINTPQDHGYYEIYISTIDEGISWEIEINDVKWGLIGSACPTGWDLSINMDYTGNHEWNTSVSLQQGELLFRTNDSWDYHLGGSLNQLRLFGDPINNWQLGLRNIVLKTTDKGRSFQALIQ